MRRPSTSRVWALCFGLVITLASVPHAQQAPDAKEPPPTPGSAKDFVVPKPTRFTLPNGLPVTMVAFGTVPKVRIQLAVDAGNVFESANEIWLADVTGSMLEEGTAALTADALARELATMGGELAIAVGPDRANLSTEVLGERGPQALRLLADVAQRPRLPESELARVKATHARNLAIQKDTPQALAMEQFATLTYGDHPYGRVFPSEAMLNGYTLEDVRRFHRDHFGPKRAHLYIAGVFDAAAMESAVREAFGSWTGGAESKAPATAERPRGFKLLNRTGAPQSTILLGLHVPDPSSQDWVALEVTNSLLGGSFASRITSNIREQKGYTYSPNSGITTHPKDSQWIEQADVTTAVTGPALKEIFAEIDRLRREAPPAEELRGIQNNLAGLFVVQNASRAGVINRLVFVDQHGLGDDYLSAYVKRVMAVTPDEVRRVASDYLVPDKMTLVVVGDEKTVKEQVASWETK
jgi:zinc protease